MTEEYRKKSFINVDEFRSQFLESSNQRVLLMLSGGKDSSACLHIMCEMGIDVTAIHFTHKWGSSISSDEARRLCRELQVELIEIDFTKEFFQSINGFKGGRPCLICKPLMYEFVIRELQKGYYGWVCIGDNANDTTTIARLNTYINDKPNENKFCSSYFGSERGVVLPNGVMVIRPLLNLDSNEIELYLKSHNITINNNNSTGDKYFEYSREGCPVQFHDPGYPISSNTLDKLFKYNTILSDFARKNNIRASVHLPSTFIVTIPPGFEIEAAQYLELAGLVVDWNVNAFSELPEIISYVMAKLFNIHFFNDSIYKNLYARFLERLNYKIISEQSSKLQSVWFDVYECIDSKVSFVFDKSNCILLISFLSQKKPNRELLENLVIEIFRTRQFKISIGS